MGEGSTEEVRLIIFTALRCVFDEADTLAVTRLPLQLLQHIVCPLPGQYLFSEMSRNRYQNVDEIQPLGRQFAQ